jgi:hypothetical protein
VKRYLSGLMCRWGIYHAWIVAPSSLPHGGEVRLGRTVFCPEVCARCGAVRVMTWLVLVPGEMFSDEPSPSGSAPARP